MDNWALRPFESPAAYTERVFDSVPPLRDDLNTILTEILAQVLRAADRARQEAERAQREADARIRVLTFEEVAAATHSSAQKLQADCREGKIEHYLYGKFRGMTYANVEDHLKKQSGLWLARNRMTADQLGLEQAREASRKNARRVTRRRMS